MVLRFMPLLATAGCFSPSYQNPTCGPQGECPSGLVCISGTCRTPTNDASNGNEAMPDAPPDGPPGSVTVTFQNGVNNYGAAIDTYIDGQNPGTTHTDDTLIRMKYDPDKPRAILIRFDEIIGLGKVTLNATILSATLTVSVNNNNAAGKISEVAIPWAETVTWDTFGLTPGIDGTDLGLGVADVPTMIGPQSIDVKQSLIAWAQDGDKNYGWIFIPTQTGAGDTTLKSTEDGVITNRPKLSVTFFP
jgi:hypothetical protein